MKEALRQKYSTGSPRYTMIMYMFASLEAYLLSRHVDVTKFSSHMASISRVGVTSAFGLEVGVIMS